MACWQRQTEGELWTGGCLLRHLRLVPRQCWDTAWPHNALALIYTRHSYFVRVLPLRGLTNGQFVEGTWSPMPAALATLGEWVACWLRRVAYDVWAAQTWLPLPLRRHSLPCATGAVLVRHWMLVCC